MKLKIHRDLKKLIKELLDDGWIVDNKNNHVKIYSPDGLLRTVAGSSLSDERGIKNIRADIRKARENYDRRQIYNRNSKENLYMEKS